MVRGLGRKILNLWMDREFSVLLTQLMMIDADRDTVRTVTPGCGTDIR